MDIFSGGQSAINAIAQAGEDSGYQKYNFICSHAINFVTNDSGEYALQINFDQPVGQAGTIVLYPGETMNDLQIACRELYAKGIGGPAPFRAVGY